MATQFKKVIIVGGGLVGQTLAAKLAYDGLDVAVIESDAGRARDLREELDVEVLVGNGAKMSVLREAGVEKAGLVVAATDSDETNLTAGFVATHVFQVQCVVVRVRDEGHEEGFRAATANLPGNHTCVNPDAAAVDHIARLLEVPGSLDVMQFLDGELLVAAFRIGDGSDFVGLQVSDMQLLFAATPTVVVAIHHDDSWGVPRGDDRILAGDILYFAIARDELQDVLSLVGVSVDQRARILIAGATPVGIGLARSLEGQHLHVVLVEEDEDLAAEAADQLSDTLVIQGRVTDQELLIEEEIERVATYVAVTDDHETNLVSGLVAKRLGAGRAFCPGGQSSDRIPGRRDRDRCHRQSAPAHHRTQPRIHPRGGGPGGRGSHRGPGGGDRSRRRSRKPAHCAPACGRGASAGHPGRGSAAR